MPKFLTSIRWRWPALGLLALATLAGCVGLDTQQRKWIFQASVLQTVDDGARLDGIDDVWIPLPGTDPARPVRVGGAGHEQPVRLHGKGHEQPVRLHGKGHEQPVRLHGLWADGPRPDAPLLLYLHGARRNVESSAFRIRHMRELGFAVLAIDYRGFGRSSDALPSEDSVAEDARAAWAWLAARQPGRDRYIFGHSLGGAIAVRLASEVPDAKGLIVEGTFTSIPAVIGTMKWGWLPIGPLITQRFDSAARIEKVKVPVLVVHGANDSLIPPALGQALYEQATGPKRFELVEGGTHYSTNGRGERQYREALRALFGLGA